ncbi:RNA-directed DNA polymerase, eukaryota, reverse transcriptase zinc-binding domain protein [Tanacetum coccineum]
MIRNTPIILTKWSPNMPLTKDKVTKVPVWVKMHKVPIIAYYKDGLSLIATQVGKPIMLDAFTSEMCAYPWGKLRFARALIKLVYEWKPPLCLECHVFGHSPEQCPKRVTQPMIATAEGNNDGFTTVLNRKKKGKAQASAPNKINEGVKMNKPKDESLGDKDIGETRRLNNDTKDAEPDPNSSDSENIRGLNRAPKQFEVHQVVNENQLSICAILESHVDIATLSSNCSKVFRAWDWTSNGRLCDTGCRIIIGWNMDVVDLVVLFQSRFSNMHDAFTIA